MKAFILAGLAAMTFSSVARADPSVGPLMGTISQFADDFNKGDAAAAAALMTPDVMIIDEVPPFIWRGTNAMKMWLSDLSAYDKAHGNTDGAVTLGAPFRQFVSGSRGYFVIAAVYNFKTKGVPMTEPAEMTFALRSGPSGWKIVGWSWDGTEPKSVASH